MATNRRGQNNAKEVGSAIRVKKLESNYDQQQNTEPEEEMLGAIRRASKAEVEGKVDKRRFSKLEMSHVSGAMDSVTKSKLLERSLRDTYCRPMIKMFKYFNSDDMMVLETPDFDEVLYNEMTKVQLKKHIDAFKRANESQHAVR